MQLKHNKFASLNGNDTYLMETKFKRDETLYEKSVSFPLILIIINNCL